MNKTMPSHHQSAEQWLTQLTRMRNCTPTKRPHQAEGDKTIGTYIQEEQQKKQPRISSQSTHPDQPYNLVSLPKFFNEGTQQHTSTQRTKLQQAKPNSSLQQPSDAGTATWNQRWQQVTTDLQWTGAQMILSHPDSWQHHHVREDTMSMDTHAFPQEISYLRAQQHQLNVQQTGRATNPLPTTRITT